MTTFHNKTNSLLLCLALTVVSLGLQGSGPLIDVSEKLDGFVRGDGFDGLAGAAWFDYNNDGCVDLYIPNRSGLDNALFQNSGDGTFIDVAASAGVTNGSGNSGVTAADIDNDGCTDLFLTGDGAGTSGLVHAPVKLYRNQCDGTFADITDTSGVVGGGSTLSAAFGDINNDRFVDLFITNAGSHGLREQHKSQLFLNNGDMTFTDISASAGIDTALGGCVVAFHDHDEDGFIDIFVGNCNDLNLGTPPFELWRNNGDLTFTDIGPQVGIDNGGSWMTANFGDIDNDGDFDLFSTNLGNMIPTFINSLGPLRPHILYENNGDGTYTNIAQAANIAANGEFSWGGGFADFDNDGFLDLVYSGNHPQEVKAFIPPPANTADVIGVGGGNPGRVFLNNGDRTFTQVQRLGLEKRFTSGLAVGDFNNDGFPDVVIVSTTTTETTQELGTPILLQNEGNDNNWLTVRLVGTDSNADGIGALVRVKKGKGTKVRQVHAGSGFLSTDSLWLTFGLGTNNTPRANVKVKWSSGLIEVFKKVPTREITTLVEGTGKLKNKF